MTHTTEAAQKEMDAFANRLFGAIERAVQTTQDRRRQRVTFAVVDTNGRDAVAHRILDLLIAHRRASLNPR